GFTPVSFEIQPTLFASQSATVEPVSQLTYSFSDADGTPMNVSYILDGVPHSGTQATFTPGKQTLGLTFEGQQITVTPTWTFSEQLHNKVDLKAALEGDLKVGEISAKVKGFGEKDFGPLYEKTFDFVDTTLQTLFDDVTPITTQPTQQFT